MPTSHLDLPLVRAGKVRELYATDRDDQLLMVATDNVSAFDRVLPTPIPDKGAVLTQLSTWWLGELHDVVPNHLVSTQVPAAVAGRAVVVERVEMVPVECVVRGYLAGSAWREYRETGSVCGTELPRKLLQGERLERPLFTPARKAPQGEHDENITYPQLAQTVGPDLARQLWLASMKLYVRAERIARSRGLILVDTKFEFGRREDGTLVLADEILTPDSSRYWLVSDYRPGQEMPAQDKQLLRDWLATESGWDPDSGQPAPELPDPVVAALRERYIITFRRLTGHEVTPAEPLPAAGSVSPSKQEQEPGAEEADTATQDLGDSGEGDQEESAANPETLIQDPEPVAEGQPASPQVESADADPVAEDSAGPATPMDAAPDEEAVADLAAAGLGEEDSGVSSEQQSWVEPPADEAWGTIEHEIEQAHAEASVAADQLERDRAAALAGESDEPVEAVPVDETTNGEPAAEPDQDPGTAAAEAQQVRTPQDPEPTQHQAVPEPAAPDQGDRGSDAGETLGGEPEPTAEPGTDPADAGYDHQATQQAGVAHQTTGPTTTLVVEVMPKPEILDPQGKAVTGALHRLGFPGLSVRQGKRFEIQVEGELSGERIDQVRQAAQMLLANTVIEDFQVVVPAVAEGGEGQA